MLRTVAWREGEHGMSFAKRVNELGFELRDRDDLNLADRLAVAGSDRSDLEKMEYFGQDRLDEVLGAFDDIFKDHTIDIRPASCSGATWLRNSTPPVSCAAATSSSRRARTRSRPRPNLQANVSPPTQPQASWPP